MHNIPDNYNSELDAINCKIKAIEEYILAKNLYHEQEQLNCELSENKIDWSSGITISKQKKKKFIDRFLEDFINVKSDTEILSIITGESVLNDLSIVMQKVDELYIKTMLSGTHDHFPCFINIAAGAGGTEAQDWASMLFNMYYQFANKGDSYKCTIIEYTAAEDAGIKNAVLKVESNESMFPHGMLKGETGTHRLVRQSPFNANGNRHTSFASVQVVPVIDEDTPELAIPSSDLRIDTYRASGAGGQHVNKTDSAVRIKHLPTGLVAQSQNERSQHRNRDSAMTILRSKIFALYEAQRKENAKSITGEYIPASWGSQIRSYVLDSARIKDLRTGLESTRPGDVLAGNIQPFLDKYIEWSSRSK